MRNLPDDCTVRLVDLPTAVGGSISETHDGHLNIYINARLSHDGRRRALDHELRHANRDDLHSAEDVKTIEARADLPPLRKARDLAPPPHPQSLPPMGKVDFPENARIVREKTDEVPVTPHQARVIMHALSDLDRFLFSDTCDPYF